MPRTASQPPYRPRRFNKRSRQRFERDRRYELVRHLGRDPTYTEWLIIGRIIAIEFELQKYDDKMTNGEELSGHLLRARLAAENRLRLDLRELNSHPHAAAGPSLQDVLAGIASRRQPEPEDAA